LKQVSISIYLTVINDKSNMKRINRLLTAVLLTVATFIPTLANVTFTLYGDTHLSNTIPINNVYLDEVGTRTQVIYPASDLSRMTGEVINSMKFYVYSPITVSGGCIQVSLGETDKPDFTDVNYVEEMTPVATISMVNGATEVEIVFETPYYYKGGNLVFETIVNEVASNYSFANYLGERPGIYNAITRGEITKFLPMTTFNYGTSDDYSAKVLPFDLYFKMIRANREDVQTVVVTNTGLKPFAPSFSAEIPFIAPVSYAVIPAGSSLEVPVRFAPTATGDYTGTLTVDCGEAGIHRVTLHGTAIEAATDLVAGDDTDYASYVPIYGADIDIVGTQGQVIYPKNMLRDMVGNRIVGLQFHIRNHVEMDGGVIQLSLKEVNDSAFATAQVMTGLTAVATMTPVLNSDEFVFYFDEPFEYQGDNLLVDCMVIEAGISNYNPTNFYGTPMDYQCSVYNTKWYSGFETEFVPFMPMATFAYQSKSQSQRGDVDGDGEVNIGDVTRLIDILLGGPEASSTADCNLDGTIDIADVTVLIDYLLSGSWE